MTTIQERAAPLLAEADRANHHDGYFALVCDLAALLREALAENEQLRDRKGGA